MPAIERWEWSNEFQCRVIRVEIVKEITARTQRDTVYVPEDKEGKS